MAEFEGDRLVFLEGRDFAVASDRSIPAMWRSGFGRHEGDELLARLYRVESGCMTGRGYPDSVRQRFRLWETIASSPGTVSVIYREGADGSAGLAAYVPDGEPLPSYLSRGGVASELEFFVLFREVVAWLEALAMAPRLLANVEMGDFLVHMRDGWRLEVTFCPAGSMLREEVSLSDHRLATVWTERIAGVHDQVTSGRRGFAEKLGLGGRPFRPLLRQLESGPDRSLGVHLSELGEILARGAVAGGGGDRTSLSAKVLPLGPLASWLAASARESDPALYGKSANPGADEPVLRSFSIASTSLDGSRPCLGLLLPPESWFQDSLIDCLNRRLAHPFLKAHHHCFRIRSVYCDDRVTVLRTDTSVGIPLPTLLAALDGMKPDETLAVAHKLHRALAQFESAGFDAELDSPWQVELHLESAIQQAGWESLLRTGLMSWPSWAVIIRCEKPVESLLPGVSNSTWDWMLQRLDLKFFPALVAWVLEWKRLQLGSGEVWNVPLSADERLASLFEAAAIHLDPGHTGQRAKFLALLEEGLMGDPTLSGPAA